VVSRLPRVGWLAFTAALPGGAWGSLDRRRGSSSRRHGRSPRRRHGRGPRGRRGTRRRRGTYRCRWHCRSHRGHRRSDTGPLAVAVQLEAVFAACPPELGSGVTVRVHVTVGVRVRARLRGSHGRPTHRCSQRGRKYQTRNYLSHSCAPDGCFICPSSRPRIRRWENLVKPTDPAKSTEYVRAAQRARYSAGRALGSQPSRLWGNS
jgi:hypothetical protein